VFTIKSNHWLSEVGYDKIVEWVRSSLPERNRLKKKIYATKSIMKPLNLCYYKINMCPNFCMLYNLENTELTDWRTCGHSHYKPRIGRESTLVAHKDCWARDTNHMIFVDVVMVKPGNTLTMCFLHFQWRLGICILGYV
jgi:hypothetical protein